MRLRISALFDSLYSERRQKQLDRLVAYISVAGLFIHLALVFLARTLTHPPAPIAAVGRNYLSAIYTPFSFILFYEVLMLIGALPQSTTQSIAKQYEIVSLIFVRTFFKDIAELRNVNELVSLSPEAWPVVLNLSAGLLMFLLVTVFLHAARRRGDERRVALSFDRRLGRSAIFRNFLGRLRRIPAFPARGRCLRGCVRRRRRKPRRRRASWRRCGLILE